jgi:hypothetical protein
MALGDEALLMALGDEALLMALGDEALLMALGDEDSLKAFGDERGLAILLEPKSFNQIKRHIWNLDGVRLYRGCISTIRKER